MSDDPLRLTGLDADAIDEAVAMRKTSKKKAPEPKEPPPPPPPKPIPTPAPPPPPPVPQVDKSLLLDKIQQYRERFPNLKSRNKLTGKSTLDEIEDELHYCELQLGQKDGHMGTHVFLLAMSGLEEMTSKYYNPLGLNLNGLTQVARDNEAEFAPLLDELVIKYATNMYVGPEMRLAMATATLIYTVHAANTGNHAVAQAMQAMNQPVKAPKGSSEL